MRHLTQIALILATFLCQQATADDWAPVREVTYPQGNLSFSCQWLGKDGLVLRASQPNGKREVTFKLTPKDAKISTSPKDAFPDAVRESAQYDLDWLPETSTNVSVLLKFRQESWVFYIDNRLAMIIPAPFMPPANIEISSDQKIKGQARFQKTMDFTFDDMFLVPEADDNGLTEWTQESGTWSLHTAAQNTFERGDIKKTDSKVPLPERSPNFYSLLGKGTNAWTTTGYSFYDSYVFASAVRVTPGEMGLIFHQSSKGGKYAFTLEMKDGSHDVLCQLWKSGGEDFTSREVLSAASITLTPNQWVRMQVVTYQDRVQCYVDNTEIVDTHASLPPGGKFGLFATSPNGVQFDDVSARTHHRLDLAMVGGIRRHTIAKNGNFFPRRFFRLFAGRDTDKDLEVSKSKEPQWLIVGSPAHREQVFSADFTTEQDNFAIGLISSYKEESTPHYRFTAQRKGAHDTFYLSQIKDGSVKQLENAEFAAPALASLERRTMSLMFDGSNTNELRFYRDGTLVMIHHPQATPSGGSGIYVEPGTRATISNLVYDSRRENIYQSRFEKNDVFVNDAFMRHWSSPEGEWLPLKNGLVWHKSDFFGGFLLTMPFIPASAVHLGIGEGQTNGVLIVRAAKDKLELSDGKDVLMSADISKLTEVDTRNKKGPKKVRTYSVNYEDHWLWVMSGNKLVFKHPIPETFAGRRIRVAGMTSDQLRDSKVIRRRVKDYLFTESPFEWRINGGTWSVVNRFFCQPQWSHMNGESEHGIAALWTKYKYGGDFCVEMYAGMRHTWYKRPGDLNMTMMASDTSPSLGYTITCTGWDPDHSQLYTRLYRNGKELAVSDKYLVPRIRVGDVRKGYNPLINSGRGMHGAWYYMKLRRIGKTLEYYFDNELVVTVEDEEPLNNGLAGIWTFMNSMMVARVKIAAERIEPHLLKVTALEPIQGPEKASAPQHLPPVGLLRDDIPIALCAPQLWATDDSAGQMEIDWQRGDNRRYFSTRSVLGNGNMFARSTAPHRPYTSVAGWQFNVKRTDAAKFNFHFSVGTMKDDIYTVETKFFHRLSGTDFSEGLSSKIGETLVPGIPRDSADWHTNGVWTQVTAWIPPEILRPHLHHKENLYIRAEGFGIDQPCYELAGLRGNTPGSGYAVRDFAEIGYRVPFLEVTGSAPFSALNASHSGHAASISNISALQDWAESISITGLVDASLSVESSNSTDTLDLLWINEPAPPQLTCDWSKVQPNTIEIRKSGTWPNQQFGFAQVKIGEIDVPATSLGLNTLSVTVPRVQEFMVQQNPELEINVTLKDKAQQFTLPWKSHELKSRPVLLNIDGAVGFFESFELQDSGEVSKRTLSVNRASAQEEFRKFQRKKRGALKRSSWRNDAKADISIDVSNDDICNRYMQISNGGKEARLRTSFAIPRSLAHFPLLGFSYQATGMAHISVMPVKNGVVKLSEPYGVTAPWSEPLILDNKWHSWLGDISKVVRHEGSKGDPFSMSRLLFGSMHGKDQTGRFSKWNIDNIILGPAVSAPAQLSLTPEFFEFAGIETVRVCIRQGAGSFRTLSGDEKKKLKWTSYADKEEVVPSLDDLEDGLCFMFIQARGSNGLDSDVTELPFILDRSAPTCSFAFEKEEGPGCNGTMLNVEFKSTGHHTPINPSQMSLACEDYSKALSLSTTRSRVEQRGDTDRLYLNWPYIFRDQLDAATNGQTMNVVLSDIADGAGNSAPDLVMPFTIDYANDHRPPTIISLKSPSNILWRLTWKDDKDEISPFRASKNCKTVTVWPQDEEPYIETHTYEGKVSLSRTMSDLKWSITNHPYLSFRIKRPTLTASNEAKVSLIVDFGHGKASIALTEQEKSGRQITLSEPIGWNSSRWSRVTLDLPKLLERYLKKQKVRSRTVKSLSFRLTGGSKQKKEQETLLLQSLAIHREWRPDDTIEIDAYDASGMDGMTVQAEYDTQGSVVSPIQLQKTGARWMMVRAKDKAGNLTRPYRYPVIEKKADEDQAVGKDD